MKNMLNNPASRLHSILSAVFKQDANKKMQVVWQELFKLKSNEYDKISSIQPRLISLAFEIDKAINNIQHLHSQQIYLKQIDKISTAIYNLGHVHIVMQLRQAINDELLDSLHICSDLLNSNSCNENTIKEKDLEDLLILIESLIKMIDDVNIENEFKKIILSILLDLKYAIDFYAIHGVDGFRLYSERFVGNLVFHKDEFSNLKTSKETKGIFDGLIETFDKSNKLVTFAKNTKLALPFIKEIIDKIA